MMRRAFQELGYRRYEWKTDSLNTRSRAAAERYGFRFEGIFRQAVVYKGRSRDTAWYSILDSEWPAVERGLRALARPGQLRLRRGASASASPISDAEARTRGALGPSGTLARGRRDDGTRPADLLLRHRGLRDAGRGRRRAALGAGCSPGTVSGPASASWARRRGCCATVAGATCWRALAGHEIASHSDMHSAHPTPAEYLERLPWAGGVQRFLAEEGRGVRDLCEILGQQPSAWCKPGNSSGGGRALRRRAAGDARVLRRSVRVGRGPPDAIRRWPAGAVPHVVRPLLRPAVRRCAWRAGRGRLERMRADFEALLAGAAGKGWRGKPGGPARRGGDVHPPLPGR